LLLNLIVDNDNFGLNSFGEIYDFKIIKFHVQEVSYLQYANTGKQLPFIGSFFPRIKDSSVFLENIGT